MSEPKTTKAQEVVAAMHEAFNRISQSEARPWAYDRFWFELFRHGYTAEDVEVFCLWVQNENLRREPQFKRRFHIPRMFGDLAEFDADLCIARGWARNIRPKLTSKEESLRILRPVVEPELTTAKLNPARSVKDILGAILQAR